MKLYRLVWAEKYIGTLLFILFLLSSFSTLLLFVSSDLPSDISLFFVLFLIFVFFFVFFMFFFLSTFHVFLFVVVLHSVAKLASNNIWSLQYIEIPNGDHNQILNHAKDEIFDAMGVVEEM